MRIIGISFCVTLLFLLSCGNSGDKALNERLIRFSDETLTISQADGAEVLLIYKTTQGEVLDSMRKWIPKDYFVSHRWFNERFQRLRKGERFEWELPGDWKDPQLKTSFAPGLLEMEIIEIWTVQKWMNALTIMAQNEQFSEDTIVQWIGSNGLNIQPWDVRKQGLLWRWIGERSGAQLDSVRPLTTFIGTYLLDDTPVGKTIVVTALTSHQQQWIPAVQWVLPYAQDGDSIEIISKSEWTFEHPENMGIAPHTPLKFRVGVHNAQSSDVKLQP